MTGRTSALGEVPFGRSRHSFETVVAWLGGDETSGLEHAELEATLVMCEAGSCCASSSRTTSTFVPTTRPA